MRHVLCFGDSNTHGAMATAAPELARLDSARRWPAVAQAALGPGWELIAEGQPGRTTVHPDPVEGGHKAGIAALPMLLESHRPLDAVVVMLGTNDLKHRFAATAWDIAEGIGRLVACIGHSDAGPGGAAPVPLVVAPVPIVETGWLGEMFRGGTETSRELAAAIGRLAARQGFAWLDAGAVAEVDPVDGIHLDAKGQAAIGRAVAARLRELLD